VGRCVSHWGSGYQKHCSPSAGEYRGWVEFQVTPVFQNRPAVLAAWDAYMVAMGRNDESAHRLWITFYTLYVCRPQEECVED
jgi:hypothetical protein